MESRSGARAPSAWGTRPWPAALRDPFFLDLAGDPVDAHDGDGRSRYRPGQVLKSTISTSDPRYIEIFTV
jgi:hypothetical protein